MDNPYTAIIILVDDIVVNGQRQPQCGACELFKQKFMADMENVFRNNNISIKRYIASDFRGLGPDAEPKFLSHIIFFPCIILIKNSDLELARTRSLTDLEVYNRILAFNADTLKPGQPRLISPIPNGIPNKYNMNRDDYQKFIDDFKVKCSLPLSSVPRSFLPTTPTRVAPAITGGRAIVANRVGCNGFNIKSNYYQ